METIFVVEKQHFDAKSEESWNELIEQAFANREKASDFAKQQAEQFAKDAKNDCNVDGDVVQCGGEWTYFDKDSYRVCFKVIPIELNE